MFSPHFNFKESLEKNLSKIIPLASYFYQHRAIASKTDTEIMKNELILSSIPFLKIKICKKSFQKDFLAIEKN